jgi:predicted TIM-barrel fold metal-dependent hydrolase
MIDAFCHVMPARIYERLSAFSPGNPSLNAFKTLPELWDLERHLALIDEFPDYRQVLSLANPPLELVAGPDDSPDLARFVNDEMSAFCANRPDRFAGFVASMPMNNPDACVGEARRAISQLGACGVQVFTNVAGKSLSAPDYVPLFETMAALDRPVWIHPVRPATHADYPGEAMSENEIWFTFGWPYETSACVTRLIYSGLLDRLPGLKIITHHMGGMIPYFAEKIGLGFSQIFHGAPGRNPAAERAGLKRQPLDYYHMLYGDTALNGSAAATRCGHAFFGTAHSLFATDAPFDSLGGRSLIRGTIAAIEALDITPAERAMIFDSNAKALFGIT